MSIPTLNHVYRDGRKHIEAGRAEIVEIDGRLWWKKIGDRDRIPGVWQANEYIYSIIAKSVVGALGYVGIIPDVLRDGPDTLVEYVSDIVNSLERSGTTVDEPLVTVVSMLDAALFNSDRLCSQIYLSKSQGWIFLDHDQSLLGNGGSDLNRFTRPVSLHPHGNYIRDVHFRPAVPEIAIETLSMVEAAWTEDILEPLDLSEIQREALFRLPEWWSELRRRIQCGEFFRSDTWEDKCGKSRREVRHGATRNHAQPVHGGEGPPGGTSEVGDGTPDACPTARSEDDSEQGSGSPDHDGACRPLG